MTQDEYDDDTAAIKVHQYDVDALTGRAYATCSGLEYDPLRWAESLRPRVQCPACTVAARRARVRMLTRHQQSTN